MAGKLIPLVFGSSASTPVRPFVDNIVAKFAAEEGFVKAVQVKDRDDAADMVLVDLTVPSVGNGATIIPRLTRSQAIDFRDTIGAYVPVETPEGAEDAGLDLATQFKQSVICRGGRVCVRYMSPAERKPGVEPRARRVEVPVAEWSKFIQYFDQLVGTYGAAVDKALDDIAKAKGNQK